MVSGNMDAFQIENLMDNEIETHHHEGEVPAHCIAKLGDGLPAFGIVAAVMGVVHTMESVGLPPAELGILIAHALVGTFLGILLAYGFVGPLASLLEQKLDRVDQDVPVREGHAAGQPERLRAGAGGRVRPQGAVLDRAPVVHRTRRTHQAGKDQVSIEDTETASWLTTDLRPIVVKRIKKVAGGHHGGAWKIAYADFVTAMMAFFLLMWLLGSTAKGDLQGIAEYFSDAAEGGDGRAAPAAATVPA